jgi:hypothetical protein
MEVSSEKQGYLVRLKRLAGGCHVARIMQFIDDNNNDNPDNILNYNYYRHNYFCHNNISYFSSGNNINQHHGSLVG